METNNGGLFFEAGMDNEKLKAGIEETIRRIQGLSDASVKGGKAMDEVFDKVSADIASSFEKIDFIVNEHKDSIKELEKEYRQIGLANRGMSIELGSGGYLTERQQAIAKEVRMRKELIKEAEESADKLQKEEVAFGKLRKKVEENATAHQSLRARIRELKEEMASMIDQGINEQSDAYKALTAELGRLQDIQGDIAQQGKVLANDEASFQGVIAGLSGLAGGFSAATGAMSLFASENENLQAVMAKIQSVMAITIGMQQVSQALNKDSAFRLVTLRKIKEWWAGIVVRATAAETAEAAAIAANTAAKNAQTAAVLAGVSPKVADTAATVAQTTASVTGTAANWSLATSFKAVGLAIKSIPVFGWIAAGLGILIPIISKFSSKAEELAKRTKKLIDVQKNSGEIYVKSGHEISEYVRRLDKFNGSKEQERKICEELNSKYGEAVGYYSSVSKWKDVLVQKGASLVEMLMMEADAQALLNEQAAAYVELERIKKTDASEQEGAIGSSKNWVALLSPALWFVDNNLGISEKYDKQNKRKAERKAEEDYEFWKLKAEEKRKQLEDFKKKNGMGDFFDTSVSAGSNKKGDDPFTAMLEDRKKKYGEYFKWLDAGYEKEAQIHFAGLLKNGKTYKEYLQGLIDSGNLTKKHLYKVFNELSSEANETVMDAFKRNINEQLEKAETAIKQQEIIANEREKLRGSTDGLNQQKIKLLDDLDKDVNKKHEKDIERLRREYADYNQQRLEIEKKFNEDKAAMYDKNGNFISGITQRHLDELERKYTNALANLDNKFSKTKNSIEDIFEDMSRKSSSEIRKIVDKAKDMVAFVKLGKWDYRKASLFGIGTEAQFRQLNEQWEKSPELLKDIERALLDLSNVADQSDTAFKKISLGIKKVFSAKAKADLDDGLENIQSGFSSIVQMGEMLSNSLKSISEISKSGVLSDTADGISQVMDAIGSVAQGAKAGSSFGVYGTVIGAVLGLASSLFKTLSANKKHSDAISEQLRENQTKAYIGEFEVNKLYRERYEWAKKIGEETLLHIKRSGQELSRQTDANSKEQESLWDKLINQEYKAGEYRKKTGLFGWGKGKIVTQWESLAGKTWEEIEKLAAQGKLSEEGVKYYNALKSARMEGDSLAKRQEEFIEKTREVFTGSTYENIVNSIINGFKAGKRSAADFADTFQELMQSAIASALQLAADKKTREFYEEFAKRSSDEDGLTKEDIKDLNKLWSSVIDSLSKDAANLEKVTDIKLSGKSNSSLTGAVRGVTEETASMVAGQMNAIRINQMEATNMLRKQLFHLSNIDRNTGSIDKNTKYIKAIYDKMSSGDTLRAKGLQ